jgi:hypothetical protein
MSTATKPAIKRNGYYVELADNGPWLTKMGAVTHCWDERGIWDTAKEAEDAINRSLHIRVNA